MKKTGETDREAERARERRRQDFPISVQLSRVRKGFALVIQQKVQHEQKT